MVGFVVASHGRLAEELLSTAEQIVGDIDHAATCSIQPGASPEEIRENMKSAMSSVDDGEGVIVFADLIGGSPCTQSLTLCRTARIEVLTGVNLPMLLKAAALRRDQPKLTITELASLIAECGQRAIRCASEALRRAS